MNFLASFAACFLATTFKVFLAFSFFAYWFLANLWMAVFLTAEVTGYFTVILCVAAGGFKVVCRHNGERSTGHDDNGASRSGIRSERSRMQMILNPSDVPLIWSTGVRDSTGWSNRTNCFRAFYSWCLLLCCTAVFYLNMFLRAFNKNMKLLRKIVLRNELPFKWQWKKVGHLSGLLKI